MADHERGSSQIRKKKCVFKPVLVVVYSLANFTDISTSNKHIQISLFAQTVILVVQTTA